MLEGMEQRRQYTCTTCPKRMSQRDRAAVHVDLVPVPALIRESVTIRQDLCREGFIELDQVDIFQFPIYFLEQLRDRISRCGEQILRFNSSLRVTNNPRHWRELVLPGVGF